MELIICFECSRVAVLWNGKERGAEATKADPQKYLDDLLTVAKVPLAAKPDKKK